MPARSSLQHTTPSVSSCRFEPGSANRSFTDASRGNGPDVRIAMPPRLKLSDSAAAMVPPARYDTGIPITTLGLSRRLKLSGNRCGAIDGRMCSTALYSLR